MAGEVACLAGQYYWSQLGHRARPQSWLAEGEDGGEGEWWDQMKLASEGVPWAPLITVFVGCVVAA